jgi:16S rRNA (cytosine1402-N4)-methyltransferase
VAAAAAVAEGIVADLGLSSHQLDTRARGFSFLDPTGTAPLDMRFDQRRGAGLTAADLVNHLSESELRRLFVQYGEEPFAVQIAAAIADRRTQGPFRTTGELAALVKDTVTACKIAQAKRGRSQSGTGLLSGGSHPATRVFQALRIAVNGELEAVTDLLDVAPRCLRVGGVFAVITFHSLEDRLVKGRFKRLSREGLPSANMQFELVRFPSPFDAAAPDSPPVVAADGTAKPSSTQVFCHASAAEVAANPRARSATLRALRRIQ